MKSGAYTLIGRLYTVRMSVCYYGACASSGYLQYTIEAHVCQLRMIGKSSVAQVMGCADL